VKGVVTGRGLGLKTVFGCVVGQGMQSVFRGMYSGSGKC